VGAALVRSYLIIAVALQWDYVLPRPRLAALRRHQGGFVLVASAAVLVELEHVFQRWGPGVVDKLNALSVFTVLDRLPIPASGVGTCAILFCRNAFSEMFGHPKAALAGMYLLLNFLGFHRVGM
jgi:hypothetical protein